MCTFFYHSSHLYYVSSIDAWLVLFLLYGDARSRNCLVPGSIYPTTWCQKFIWILQLFVFANGGNRTRAACAASDHATHYIIAPQLFDVYLAINIFRICQWNLYSWSPKIYPISSSATKPQIAPLNYTWKKYLQTSKKGDLNLNRSQTPWTLWGSFAMLTWQPNQNEANLTSAIDRAKQNKSGPIFFRETSLEKFLERILLKPKAPVHSKWLPPTCTSSFRRVRKLRWSTAGRRSSCSPSVKTCRMRKPTRWWAS